MSVTGLGDSCDHCIEGIGVTPVAHVPPVESSKWPRVSGFDLILQ
jgi:hypothetical protein